jgi:CRISPR-associated protein Cas2
VRGTRLAQYATHSGTVISEDHVLLIDVGPAEKIELAVGSIGKTFTKIERQATVI